MYKEMLENTKILQATRQMTTWWLISSTIIKTKHILVDDKPLKKCLEKAGKEERGKTKTNN